MVQLLVYYIFHFRPATPVYSVLPITIDIFAFGLEVPVTLLSVFITLFIVICSNLAFTTSTFTSTLTILSFSFCVTVITVPTC